MKQLFSWWRKTVTTSAYWASVMGIYLAAIVVCSVMVWVFGLNFALVPLGLAWALFGISLFLVVLLDREDKGDSK